MAATGRYISRSDIEQRFGRRSVASWSNLDRDQAGSDEDNIQAAIDSAEQMIDDRMRDGRYIVPMVATSGALYQVQQWAATLAGIQLFESAPPSEDDQSQRDAMDDQRQNVFGEIDNVNAGMVRLNAELAEDGADAPTVVR